MDLACTSHRESKSASGRPCSHFFPHLREHGQKAVASYAALGVLDAEAHWRALHSESPTCLGVRLCSNTFPQLGEHCPLVVFVFAAFVGLGSLRAFPGTQLGVANRLLVRPCSKVFPPLGSHGPPRRRHLRSDDTFWKQKGTWGALP